jgi:hypothetical protein
MGIGSILGGIAGLLIPGGGAIASALGSGIGTLLEGGSGKDAIKNALLAGGTSAMFPGVASAIQQSAMGKAATGMFGQAGLTGKVTGPSGFERCVFWYRDRRSL